MSSLRALHLISELVGTLRLSRMKNIAVYNNDKNALVFINATGLSERHNFGVATDIMMQKKKLLDVGDYSHAIKGSVARNDKEWISLVIDNVQVNIMTEELRAKFELEKMHLLDKYDDQSADMEYHFKQYWDQNGKPLF